MPWITLVENWAFYAGAAALGIALGWVLRGLRSGRDGEAPARSTLESSAPATTASIATYPAPADPGDTDDGPADDLEQIAGIGPRVAAALRDQGILRLEQLAAVTPDQVPVLAARIGVFPERITRDDWIGQAQALVQAPQQERQSSAMPASQSE